MNVNEAEEARKQSPIGFRQEIMPKDDKATAGKN
jgi:hypothetical protein